MVAEGTLIRLRWNPPLGLGNILKADAVAKSGNDTRAGTSGLERRRLETWGGISMVHREGSEAC